MAENKKAQCGNCGGEMQMCEEGITLGWKCPDCGWGYCTTSPIISDTQTYEVYLDPGEVSADHSELISSIANRSYEKLTGSAPVLVLKGGAAEVREVRNKLEAAGVKFSIKPEFTW